jgi:hypothetical protein
MLQRLQLLPLRPDTGSDFRSGYEQLLIRRLSLITSVGSVNATHTTKYLCLRVPKRRIHTPITNYAMF